jgi:hypothetical protein
LLLDPPDELPEVPLLPVAEPLLEPGLLGVEEPLLPLVVPPMFPPELVPVLMSEPASMPRARGRFSPRRPSGAVELVPAVPPGRPLLELQAPTPASIAAAEAKVIHLLSFMGIPWV